jgi:outer membrane immunogenic protein
MKKLALALVASATLAGQAMAADMAVKAARPAPAPIAVANWTGCYIGGGAGYGMWNQDTIGRDALGVAFTTTATGGGRGWLGGVQGGCDYQFAGPMGNWVIGAFADANWGFSQSDSRPHFTVDLTADSEKIDYTWAVGGRIGYLVTPQLLTYFSGGYTETRFERTNLRNEFIPAGPTGFYIDAHTYKGWFLGSGLEYSVLSFPGLTVKTEYRYSEFDNNRIPQLCSSAALCGAVGLTGVYYDSKKFTQSVMTSLVYKFNFGGAPLVAKY